MTRQKLFHRLMIIAAALWLSACSQTSSVDDIPPGANFATKVLADNTKLFTYTQRFMRGGPTLVEGVDYSTIDSQRALREREAMRKSAPKAAKKGLEAMLLQNQYCRDGYVVLEQYEQHGSYIVRGECRDSATSAERSKFSRE